MFFGSTLSICAKLSEYFNNIFELIAMSKQDTTAKSVRVSGGVQSPISLSVSELMELAVGLERTLVELGKEKKVKEEPKISLTRIQEGSLYLELYSESPNFSDIYNDSIAIVKSGAESFYTLSEKVQKPLKRVLRFLQAHNSELQFFQQPLDNLSNETQPAAILDWLLEDDEPLYLTGNTSLYGFLIELSGMKKLKAVLQLEDHSDVKCFLPNQEMARELGSRIYKFVGLHGEAKWSFEDNTLCEFHVDEILPYEEPQNGDYAAVFKELRKEFGMHYNGIDPTTFLMDSGEQH